MLCEENQMHEEPPGQIKKSPNLFAIGNSQLDHESEKFQLKP